MYVIDTEQLLMRCREVQQFMGNRKYHYCTPSRKIDGQCEGDGLNSCSSNAGADFAQHACHAPFCVITINFVDCEFVDFREYRKGFVSKVLPEPILESTAVTSVHKVSTQLPQLGV